MKCEGHMYTIVQYEGQNPRSFVQGHERWRSSTCFFSM